MRRMLVAACAALAVGALGVGTNEAAAQFSISFGGGYGSYGYPRSSFSVGHRRGGNSRRGAVYYGSSHRYRQGRGHYDYHPPTAYRHKNHFHVQPGHYDYHRGRHGHSRQRARHRH
ncbi:MAG: hypothetical protein RIK87_28975 [Fuerstiella sp.]